jgi:hypothetical protein
MPSSLRPKYRHPRPIFPSVEPPDELEPDEAEALREREEDRAEDLVISRNERTALSIARMNGEY